MYSTEHYIFNHFILSGNVSTLNLLFLFISRMFTQERFVKLVFFYLLKNYKFEKKLLKINDLFFLIPCHTQRKKFLKEKMKQVKT